jgi:MoxR-like ATPase
MSIPDYPAQTEIPLPATGTWPVSVHSFEAGTAAALRAAEAAARPLLIRGEPGTGKSQTARAAAASAGRLFLSVVIDGRSEAHDLLWHYDAVGRLSDAQVGGEGAREPAYYLGPGPLWWAYDWPTAHGQWEKRRQGAIPEPPPGWEPAHGTVLLIDEIDKADPDLPNAFLEVLGNRGFSVPYLGHRVVRGDTPPLVVITTNEERELPQAFLRRCLVLTLELPQDLGPWLAAMGAMHLKHAGLAARSFPDVLDAAARQLIADRDDARQSQLYTPGLAEYLDLVLALARLEKTEEGQRDLLAKAARFVLRKSGPEEV